MSAPARDTRDWITVRTFADAVGVSRVTIYRLFRAGDIPGHRVSSAIRIRADFAAECKALVTAGAQVDVGQFGREWLAARQAAISAPASVAVAS